MRTPENETTLSLEGASGEEVERNLQLLATGQLSGAELASKPGYFIGEDGTIGIVVDSDTFDGLSDTTDIPE